MVNGFNPLSSSEYMSSYYAQPYAAYTNQLQPVSLQQLPPAVNVSDIIQPYSDKPQATTTPSVTTQQTKKSTPTISTDILSKLNSPLFQNTMLSRGVDQFGQSVLGIGTKAVGPTTGAATGVEGIAGGLSTKFTAGNALAGFAGQQAAKLLGLDGEYSNIGATVGGIAGSYFGPLGSALGSFAGSAISGLFGGGKPNPVSVVGSDYGVTSQGTFKDGGRLTSKHVDTGFASNMRSAVETFNTSIHQQTGLDLSKTVKNLVAGYDVNHGPGFISFNGYYQKGHKHTNPDTVFTFDPNNQQSMIQAFKNYGTKLLQTTGEEFSPEQVNVIVNNAIRSLGTEESKASSRPTVSRKDVQIAPKLEQGSRFTDFLNEYNAKYKQQAVK